MSSERKIRERTDRAVTGRKGRKQSEQCREEKEENRQSSAGKRR